MVKKEITDNPNHNIGVLCTTNDLCMRIKKALENKDLKCIFFRDKEFKSKGPGIKICTVHSAKGLSFTTVYVPYFDERAYDGKIDHVYSESYNELKNRDTAYVAMTRAESNLCVSYNLYNGPSAFLHEIDPNTYNYHDLTKLNQIPPEYNPPKQRSNTINIPKQSSTQIDPTISSNIKKPMTRDRVKLLLDELGIRYSSSSNGPIILDKEVSEDTIKELSTRGLKLSWNKNIKRYYF